MKNKTTKNGRVGDKMNSLVSFMEVKMEEKYDYCSDCGTEDFVEYFECCNKWLCGSCEERHDRKYPTLQKEN